MENRRANCMGDEMLTDNVLSPSFTCWEKTFKRRDQRINYQLMPAHRRMFFTITSRVCVRAVVMRHAIYSIRERKSTRERIFT